MRRISDCSLSALAIHGHVGHTGSSVCDVERQQRVYSSCFLTLYSYSKIRGEGDIPPTSNSPPKICIQVYYRLVSACVYREKSRPLYAPIIQMRLYRAQSFVCKKFIVISDSSNTTTVVKET